MNRLWCLMGMLWVVSASAQERPLPGTLEVPVLIEKESTGEEDASPAREGKAKVGEVRIWNFSGRGTREALGVTLIASGGSTPDSLTVLARGLRYGLYGNYVPVVEGTYRLYVFPDPVENFNPEAPIEVSGSGRLDPASAKIDVSENSYQTIILHDEGERLAITLLDDVGDNVSGYRLRLLNMTKTGKNRVIHVSGKVPVAIAKDLPYGQLKLLPMENPSRADYEFRYADEAGYELSQSVEVESKGLLSNTFLIHYDRYGRMTVTVFDDAPLIPPVVTDPTAK